MKHLFKCWQKKRVKCINIKKNIRHMFKYWGEMQRHLRHLFKIWQTNNILGLCIDKKINRCRNILGHLFKYWQKRMWTRGFAFIFLAIISLSFVPLCSWKRPLHRRRYLVLADDGSKSCW